MPTVATPAAAPMVFSTYTFLFGFLPAFLLVYALLPLRQKNLWLAASSYLFYGWWRPDFCLLMLFSTLVDFTAARGMGGGGENRMGGAGESRKGGGGVNRKGWLWLSMVTNLGLLGFFKYGGLMAGSWQAVGQTLGLPLPDPEITAWLQDLVLPVGISFYTFQSMSYTIDVYWGRVRPVRSILDLACYVAMFPQLVAGPIVRYRDVQDQLLARTHSFRMVSDGCLFLMVGLAKKVLVADVVAPLADAGFALETPGLLESWTATTAYATQIYFDFSGYSDMAIGLGLILGFRFPRNFNSPYQSRSITEFWRRWHISLSTWLRDYLYIPLGGNQKGGLRTQLNLMVTMLLGGLWHGASWTFLLWGGYQGLWLMLERRGGRQALWAGLPGFLRVVPTFVVVLIGWVIFRATSMDNLLAMWSGMVGVQGVGGVLELATYQGEAYATLGIALVIAVALRNSWDLIARYSAGFALLANALFLLAVMRLVSTDFSPFLYFQF